MGYGNVKTILIMIFEDREFQKQAVKYGAMHFHQKNTKSGLFILPTGSGKSVVIAKLIKEINVPTLILQPSIEILKQNYKKYTSLGYYAEVFSASLGMKNTGMVMFATPASIVKHLHLLKHIRYVIIDECHYVNPEVKGKSDSGEKEFGMYKTIIQSLNAKVHGLTATPYRLCSNSYGSELRFLTLQRGTMFKDIIYVVQNKQLFDEGFLAKLSYHKLPKDYFTYDSTQLKLNSTGREYSDKSITNYHKSINFPEKISIVANGLIRKGRKNCLIFVRFLEEAREIVRLNPSFGYVDGEMEIGQRTLVIEAFKQGKIKVLVNSGVLTTGFDYPELESIVLARKTMSLALYYQMIGRAMRIHKSKEKAFVVDICNNIDRFGKVEDLTVEFDGRGRPFVSGLVNNNRIQLTNVILAA